MPRGHPGQVKQTATGQVKQTAKKSKDPKFGNLGGPGPGRPKGVPNKINRDLKTQALQGNPSPFMAGLAKLLPLMLEGSKDAPIIVERVYYTRDGDA